MMLNKQGDNIQPWRTPFPIWNQSVGPCPVLTVASWPAYRFLNSQQRLSISYSQKLLLCFPNKKIKLKHTQEKKSFCDNEEPKQIHKWYDFRKQGKKNEDLCLDAHIEARSKPTFSRLETFKGQASQWSWLLVLCYITQDILKWCHVFSYQSTLISSTFLCFPFLFWKEEMFFSSLFSSWLKYPL